MKFDLTAFQAVLALEYSIGGVFEVCIETNGFSCFLNTFNFKSFNFRRLALSWVSLRFLLIFLERVYREMIN